MFSIIITTYNSEKYIEETITNVLYASNNICKEIIIDNDGCKYNTRDILKKIND
ncbi:glycosyltransferase, partial [Staphylococcus hominis]|uniref:glycosyltransferase n=1 Tax=Staphylococcus hominis TaxID=1290 RepID=UPI000E69DBC4